MTVFAIMNAAQQVSVKRQIGRPRAEMQPDEAGHGPAAQKKRLPDETQE
jgi:hypothetical protein